MHNWEFLQTATGRWYWRHTTQTGAETLSTRDFASRAECMADAIRGVYTASGMQGRKLRERDQQPPR